jgi:molybdopterin biosynthesis enzyme
MIGARPVEPEHVRLGAAFDLKPALWYFLPVQLRDDPTDGRTAMPRPTRGSGDFVSLLGTDGFVELPPGPAQYAAGRTFTLYRW